VSTQGPTPTTYALPDLNAEIKTSHVVVVQEFRGYAINGLPITTICCSPRQDDRTRASATL